MRRANSRLRQALQACDILERPKVHADNDNHHNMSDHNDNHEYYDNIDDYYSAYNDHHNLPNDYYDINKHYHNDCTDYYNYKHYDLDFDNIDHINDHTDNDHHNLSDHDYDNDTTAFLRRRKPRFRGGMRGGRTLPVP